MKQVFFDRFRHAILSTSRTAKSGIISGQQRPKKPSSHLNPRDLIAQVDRNIDDSASFIWNNRLSELSESTLFQFECDLFQITSRGIDTNKLYRTGETGAHYGITSSSIPTRMRDLRNWIIAEHSEVDPIHFAAMIEYQIDYVLHPYPDACGRMARSWSAFFLLRSELLPPRFTSRDDYYQQMNYSLDAFHAYYASCMEGT